MFHPADEKIFAFGTRFGGLQISLRTAAPRNGRVGNTWSIALFGAISLPRCSLCCGLEDSFTKANQARRKTGISFIGFHPKCANWRSNQQPACWRSFPQGAEERWLTLAHFAEKPSQRNRTLFVHLLNTVLDLGRVRPRFSWPATGRQVARPQITYSSQSLLFQLALQLCLPLAKPDSFLVCVHCQ